MTVSRDNKEAVKKVANDEVVTYLSISVEKDATLDNTPYPAFKLSKKDPE